MPLVYANSPGEAFASNSQLDQQRVQNYLQSIAANRQAQQSSWQMAAQQAAARQAAEQQQQAQMIQLAHLAAQQRAQQQNFGLSAQQIAETGRHNVADETYKTAALGRANASLLIEDNRQKRDAEAQQQEAAFQKSLADQLNHRSALVALKAKLTPTGQDEALKAATGEGYSPEADPAFASRFSWFSPQGKYKRRAEVMNKITRDARDLPADFSGATSIADYAAAATKAIDAQLARLPNPTQIKNLHTLVEDDGSGGNYRPILRLNPLLGGNRPSPLAAPTTMPIPVMPGDSNADPFAQFNAWLQQQQ